MERINKQDFKNLAVAFTFSEDAKIKSLDFEYSGERLVLNTETGISVYILRETKVDRNFIDLRRTGIGLSKFYNANYVLHTTTTHRNDIRLININESRENFISSYRGHAAYISSMCVAETFFATSSDDKTVKLWSPKEREEYKSLKFSSAPIIALNSTGKILAVAYDSSTIEIFSVDNLSESVNKIEPGKRSGVEWTSIKFSPDDKMLMISTNSTDVLIVNTLTGKEMHNLTGYANPNHEVVDSCFSLDSNFALSGSNDGHIFVWDLEDSTKILEKKNPFAGACHRVAFNPTMMNLASTSSGSNIHLWIEKDQ